MEIATFNVPSVSCSACSSKIEEKRKRTKGYNKCVFRLKKPADKVEYNPSEISPQEIKKHIAQMGYEII